MDWAIKFRFFDPEKISVFVLDEADIMIATQGHQDQCIRIQKCVKPLKLIGKSVLHNFIILFDVFFRLLPPTCQMLFFSATYEPAVMKFAELIVRNPIVIKLPKAEESLDNIKQYYVKCSNMEEKYAAITNIYGVITIGQAIIFCHVNASAFTINYVWMFGKFHCCLIAD